MFDPVLTGNVVNSTHDIGLVLVSYALAVVASLTALDLAVRIRESRGIARKIWIGGCALSMGSGIWSMHFTAMLAFKMPMAVSYDIGITLLSLVIAVVASGFAFYLANTKPLLPSKIIIGGLVMGIGVAAMHYTGMAAMQLEGAMHYRLGLFVLSVLIAIFAATAALWLIIKMGESKLISKRAFKMCGALIMGLAVVGMHYTGMAATIFVAQGDILPEIQSTQDTWLLACSIAAITLFILGVAVVASFAQEQFNKLTWNRNELEVQVRERTAELERSNKDLGDFASIASHDLQEPLRKIICFGDQLIDRESLLTPRGKDYLKRMQNASLRMQRLIDDLLNYSRVTSKPGSFERIDLNKLVDQVVEDLEMKISEEMGTVVVEEMPALEADKFQIRQLFQNLIGNSLKYHREGVPPVVEVKSAKTGNGAWVIRVEDNGIGFEKKYAERIFQIFERLHGHSAYEGTGIGLAICEKIVTRHKGTITAKSKVGEGTAFIVTLPEKQPISD